MTGSGISLSIIGHSCIIANKWNYLSSSNRLTYTPTTHSFDGSRKCFNSADNFSADDLNTCTKTGMQQNKGQTRK